MQTHRQDKMIGPPETMLNLRKDLPRAKTAHVWVDGSRLIVYGPAEDGIRIAEAAVTEPMIRKHGGYRKLKSFQVAEKVR